MSRSARRFQKGQLGAVLAEASELHGILMRRHVQFPATRSRRPAPRWLFLALASALCRLSPLLARDLRLLAPHPC